MACLTMFVMISCTELAFGQPRQANIAASALEPENIPFAKPEVLSDDELNAVLSRRTDSQLGETMGNLSKMFLVNSRLAMGVGIGVGTEDRKVMKVELQHPFPESYHPTLQELLDAIALQTSTECSHERRESILTQAFDRQNLSKTSQSSNSKR